MSRTQLSAVLTLAVTIVAPDAARAQVCPQPSCASFGIADDASHGGIWTFHLDRLELTDAEEDSGGDEPRIASPISNRSWTSSTSAARSSSASRATRATTTRSAR